MIPNELGGPDHRGNMQLACKSCNRKKGTLTDTELRQLNANLIPLEERLPPKRPIDPDKLKPESTERMRGGWIRKGREAWVMVQCPDAAGFERVRVETAMPGGC